RLLADLIPDAEYQEIEGDDHFSWVAPNWREVTDRFIEFAIGVSHQGQLSFQISLHADEPIPQRVRSQSSRNRGGSRPTMSFVPVRTTSSGLFSFLPFQKN
ncbi:MAG: hypothetical protein AAFZ80_12565, partial [Cyanobacteria bacterium P01_A01_bin.105]